jgi:antitoxin component YwqK of YwqJK toxin-antitoxin module
MRYLFLIIKVITIIFILQGCQEPTTNSWLLNKEEDVYKLNDKKYTGFVIDKSKNGKIIKQFYCHNGKLNGKYIEYYKLGRIYKSMHYLNGELHGKYLEYFKDGNIALNINYKNGELHGLYKSYHYFNGNIHCTANYKNGILDGLFKNSLSNGVVDEYGKYKNGFKTGFWVYRYTNGEIMAMGYYSNSEYYEALKNPEFVFNIMSRGEYYDYQYIDSCISEGVRVGIWNFYQRYNGRLFQRVNYF